MIRVAINGFGRIGRQVFQAGINDPAIEWVGINDLTDTKTLAYLLKYDSIHGKFKGTVEAKENSIVVNGKEVPVFAEKDPLNLPWKKQNVDVVAECTGFFTKGPDAMKHIQAGAKKVLISAPGKEVDFTVIKGVNEHLYDKKKHNIISNGSCTTNCVAPMVKVLNDNYKIKRGFMTTTHAYTATQKLVDSPDPKDLRRGRNAAVNLVLSTTGAAETVAEVIPDIKGKFDGFAIRVPVADGSIANVIVEVEKPTSVQEVNNLFKSVANYHMKGVLEYTEDPIVSSDVIHNLNSCVFDPSATRVIDKTLVNVVGWYDNEWAYSCRMVDIMKLLF